MTNFYFNLNQIQSNPDGEPTVNRQSRLMSLSGKKAEKEQLSRDCLSLASELPLTCPRPDSLSLVSRQSDLDQVRAISAAFSTRVWKHVAMIFAVLVMSVGQMWGATYTWTFDNSANNSDIDLSSKTTALSSYTTSGKSMSYVGGSSCKIGKKTAYLAMGGASSQSSNALSTRYFILTAPSANGTISVTFAGTASGNELIRTDNGDYQVIAAATSTTKVSSLLSGLTAGTTKIYIAFTGKCYISSIAWTDADAPEALTTLYSSDYKSSMESGASISVSSSGMGEQTGGSGWVSAYSKYYKATSTNKEATITFSPALSLVSDGNDRGKIRIYYGSLGHSLNTTVINDFKINGGSSIGTAYGVLEKEKVHVIEYTIPVGTSTLTTIYNKVAVSNGCLLHVEVLTHSAATSPEKTVYLKPNGIWNKDGARFAAYYWKSADDSQNGWVNMTSFCGPNYKVTIPEGYDKYILCRMNGANATNNMSNKWNQTPNLDKPTTNDTCYTIEWIDGDAYHNSTGSWGTYTCPDPTTIYLDHNSIWNADGARYAAYYWEGDDTHWVDFTQACGETKVYTAEIPAGYTNIILCRMNGSAAANNWDNKWNQTADQVTTGNNGKKFTISNINGSGSWGSYSPTTYTVSAAASTAGYGTVSAASVSSVACGTSISASTNTLTVGATSVTATAASATAEYTYAFTNWTWTPAGATVTSNVTATANFTRTPKSYTLTWNLAGGKVTVAGTGAAVNATGTPNSEVAFGTAITAPTVTKTGYTFAGWSSTPASTMPAANTTYTATWTAKTTTITINANTANHGSTAPSSITATYGSALPSFTAATGASGYSLTGYFTAATDGTKVINADGSLVRNTTYSTDESTPKWKSEAATLTLFAQYEEEVVSPSKCITFNSTSAPSVSGVTIKKVAGKSGGSTYTEDGFVMSQSGDYITFDISALGNLTKATFTAKTGSTSKKIGYGYTDAASYVDEVPEGDGTADKNFHEYEITSIPDNTTRFTLVRRGTGTTITEVCLFYTPISCSTPAAPTAFTAGSITSTGATFTITDAANAASYDIYYATSSTAPNASTPATTTSTSKTKEVTGLTASTTYYAWVRSVCDASHKSDWVALTGSSFTTSAAETPIITWEMKLTSGQNWGLNGDPSTTDNTNITSISANNTHAAQLDGKTANGTMTAGCTTAQNGTARDNNIYVEFKFHVGCDKKLTPSKISLQVSNIGGSSDGNMTYDAILTDGTRTVSGSVTPASDGTLTTLEFTNADASKYMQGDVTLRVYPYNNNGGNTGSGFRMGQYVKIFGEIANQATPAATITWNTQPANGQVGDPDFAYDVTCSDGSAVTVTSANTTYATIVGGKLHYAAAGTTHLVASATDACGNVLTPVNSNDFTVTVPVTYSITYDCDDAESGCPSNVAAATNLPNPLPSAPTKSGYTFAGWYTDSEKTVAAVAGATLTANTTLYAKWTENECTPTTLFSMVVADSGSDADVARQGGTLSLTTSNHLSTLTGGTATLKNNYASSGSAHKMVGKDNDERHLRFKQNDHLLIVTFENALAEGDIISFTGYGSNQLSFTTTETRATTPATSSKSYTIPSASGLIGATTIYIWRSSGSDTYIKSLTVTRPCDESAEACKTPNITNIASTTNMTTSETKSLNVTLGNADALTGTVSYAWTNSDGTAIAAAAKATGTTTARLTLTEPAADTYTFRCTVTNNCGGDGSQSATSAVFTVVVTASSGCTEIAKVIVSGTSTGTDSGTKIAETGGYGVKLENTTTAHDGNTGYKIGSNNYVYLQLASGEQFQNGDKVKVYITQVGDLGDGKLHIYQGTTGAGTEVATVDAPAAGWNEATLSGVTSGQRSLTVHRGSGTTEQNHRIYAFAVERCVDCTPATHEGLAYTKTSYTVGETATALTVTNPENVDTYQWKWNTTNDRTGGTTCGTNAASFIPPTTSAGTRYYWCELTNDCGTVKTSAVGITVSADLSDVTVTWTDPAGTVNYGGGGYTIKATVGPAAWNGTLTASMLTAPEGIRIYDVEINNTEHTLQAKFDVQTTFDREANATAIPFALTLAATATYDGKIDEHNVAYSACAAGGGGGILFSQNFNSATEVAYTNGTSTAINTSSGNNIVGSTAASQFTYIGIVNKSSTGIAINTESGGNSKDITGAFQAYANNSGGKYALVKTTNFAATAPTALRIEADVWFHTLNSTTDYSLSFAVGESFSDGTGGEKASNVHSGFSLYNASAVYLYAYRDKNTKISGTNQFTQSAFQKVTWVINNTGADLEYTNPAGTKSTLGDDKFDVWVGTKQFVSGQAASTGTKALQNLYIGDPNGKYHEFRLDNVTVTDISTSSGTGSLTTALTWSNSQASGDRLDKNEGTADFAVTAVRDAAATTSLGALTYSSSDQSVATVNATTGQVHIADNIDFGTAEYKETIITATLTASGCYKRAEITYVLRVNKRACDDVAGTVTTEDLGCGGIKMTLSGYTTGATIQWYKDGEAILSATSATYTATAAGEYYAVTHSTCDRTSNTVTIASITVSATKIVDEWYVKNGRRTPDIALVQTENATGFTVTTGSPASDITSTGIGGCGFYLGTDGIIYLKGAKNDGTAPSDMTEGDDVLSITATGCSDAAPVSVTIHRQVETDKYVLAYVVTGKQDGGWTQDMPSNQTTGVELYRTLNNHFDLQATNVYATTDEQKIKEYYSRYDIIFITDYPNTKLTNKTTKKSYVDALGALIDIRPILTMEAWVSGLSNWSAKGVAGNPKSPTTRQYNMLLQCKDHEIFSGTTVETIGEGDEMMFKINMVDSTKALYDTLDTKYGAGAHAEKTGYCYGKHPALQGFVYDEALADMLPLGLIDDGAGNDLQVGLERQKEMEARMMVLGINADAMERLSEDGETVIVNALKYLMKKDAEDISDCSIYFDNAGGNNLWSNVANWGPSHLTLPQPTQEARILQPCIVQGEATAASIKIISGGKYNHGSTDANGSLTIAKSGILKVGGRIVAASAPNYYEVRPTDATKLIIQADGDQTGALIHGHKSGELNATVQLVSKAYSERVTEGGKIKTKKYWQYVGLPVQEALAEDAFYGGYTYKYEESAGWEKKRTGDMLEEFWGIGLSYDNYVLGKTSPITFNISGALALATNRDIELTKTAEVGEGENMIGNSWTAPIHLVNMTDDDFENATATIYLFNTGRNDSHTNSANGSTTAGQWVSVPVAASKLDPWVGPKVIPAMQAFEVDVAGGASSGTLHLNYDKHVRAIATPTEENAPLRAPKRYMDDEPTMLRLRVADSATYTDLYLIEGEQLSDEFDNGWDGKYQQCDGRSATLYALSPIGNMAVLAQQSINNTAIVFRPGRQNEYTFTFGYNGEVAYYLNDLLLEQSTEIREGNEYRFTCNEGDMESRFVVSTTPFGAPDIATGIDNAGHPEKVQKIMYKDHIYIIRGGRIYDVVGKMVK